MPLKKVKLSDAETSLVEAFQRKDDRDVDLSQELVRILLNSKQYDNRKEVTKKQVLMVLENHTKAPDGELLGRDVKCFRMTFKSILNTLFNPPKKEERELFKASMELIGRRSYVEKVAELIGGGKPDKTIIQRIRDLGAVVIDDFSVSGRTIISVCKELGWWESFNVDVASFLGVELQGTEIGYEERVDICVLEVKELAAENLDLLQKKGSLACVSPLRDKLCFIANRSKEFKGMTPQEVLEGMVPELKGFLSQKGKKREGFHGNGKQKRVGNSFGPTVHKYTGGSSGNM